MQQLVCKHKFEQSCVLIDKLKPETKRGEVP